jgi:hypothetical protein
MAVTTSFDDLLHQLLNVLRPRNGQEQEIVSLVSELATSSGELSGNIHNDKWTRLVLSLLYKRYHRLAPEAKNQAYESPKKPSSVVVAGNGERLIFYT